MAQKRQMLAWQQKFDIPNVDTKLIYLVEGSIKMFTGKCRHSCMIQCGLPRVADVEVNKSCPQ